jgi:hypothetical protein
LVILTLLGAAAEAQVDTAWVRVWGGVSNMNKLVCLK